MSVFKFNRPRLRKGYAPEVDLEEIISTGPQNSFLQFSIERRTFQVLYVSVALAALIFGGRIIYLAGTEGAFYAVRAKQNANQEVILPAERGVILDRFGKAIAQNQPIFSVSLKISEYLKNRETIDSFLYKTLSVTESDLSALLTKADIQNSDSIIVARDIEPDKIIELKSREIAGLEIQNDFRRMYPQKEALAHTLGYVDYQSAGKTGLELFYDQVLTGEDGSSIRGQNAKGVPISDAEIKKPANGQSLTTTIDAEFQQYFYDRLSAGLTSLGRTSGVGLAIDPRNGEILAAFSMPSYDNNLFAKRGSKEEQSAKLKLLESADNSLFNRTISGLYNPASTIKPLHAVAALAEHVVDTSYRIFSPGYIEIPNPYDPGKFIRFLDWRPQGWVNVQSALARSSNVYFYEIGGGFDDLKGLGINRLISWWKKFGLGAKTGVDFPGEGEGFLPNPDEKEKRTNQIWRIGDTYNVSIGQGDLLVTPLQLLNYISAIANGGYLYEPRFNKNTTPKVISDLSSLSSEIKAVQLGMMDGVSKPYGTSYLLHDLPLPVAAKTGSAQIANNTKTDAFFTGYAPANPGTPQEPQIALLVLIENAKEGSLNAVPIAKDVLNWYYEHRIANGH
ncbi:MAG: penicillin-binding transpeptidase domain-containing protein [bacterium]|nr:penicillin-binding transpeptidase domain-containing protein [bacterium]